MTANREPVIRVPTIHLNGTSAQALYDMNRDAADALYKAIDKLNEARPNARDYYTQGDDAFAHALSQHNARVMRLQSVIDELGSICEHLLFHL